MKLTLNETGLQTPRLKRLAEIVSQQAIAQQEKLEFGSQIGEDDEEYDGESINDMTEVDQQEERPGSAVAAGAA
jgi:myosin-5